MLLWIFRRHLTIWMKHSSRSPTKQRLYVYRRQAGADLCTSGMWSSARWLAQLVCRGGLFWCLRAQPRISSLPPGLPPPAGHRQKWDWQTLFAYPPLDAHPSNPIHPCLRCKSTHLTLKSDSRRSLHSTLHCSSTWDEIVRVKWAWCRRWKSHHAYTGWL